MVVGDAAERTGVGRVEPGGGGAQRGQMWVDGEEGEDGIHEADMVREVSGVVSGMRGAAGCAEGRAAAAFL